MNLNKIAEFVESTVEKTLSYMDFPYEHWTRLRTNNALERSMIGAFPDHYSVMMLVGARSV